MPMRIKNWGDFQHYKDRCPPWIKLHRKLLDNMNYHLIDGKSAKALIMLWILASEDETLNGQLPDSIKDISFRIRMSVEETEHAIRQLFKYDFIEDVEQLATQTFKGWGTRHISKKVKQEVYERDNGSCNECGTNENIEYDHIVPVSKGGKGELENIQLLCRKCNRSKRSKPAERFATQGVNLRTPETETETERERETEAKPAQKRLSYSEDFEEFWKHWPGQVKGPKSDAFDQWKRTSTLRPDDGKLRNMIISEEHNRFNCRARGEFVAEWPHVHRWLKKRRWEELEDQEQQPQTVKMCTLNGIGPMFPLRVPVDKRDEKIAELAEKGYAAR